MHFSCMNKNVNMHAHSLVHLNQRHGEATIVNLEAERITDALMIRPLLFYRQTQCMVYA
jgi:hypothetical protein